MTQSGDINALLEAVSKVLLRSAILGFLLILVWFGGFTVAREVIHSQAKWFGLTPHETDLIQYCGIALVKMWVLVFFVFPYVSIRLVLRQRK